MSNLKQMLKNDCEIDKTLATKLSKLIGYSSPSPFYKFLNEEEREIEFQQVLTIVQDRYPDQEFEIMGKYILTLKPTQRCARESLEYTTINKLNDVFDELLIRLGSCSNKESQEWSQVYTIHRNVLNGTIERIDAIELINELTVKCEEMKVFSKIIQFYYYNDLKLVNIMKSMSHFIQNGIKKIKDGFIKSHYDCRFFTVMASIYLHTNQIDHLKGQVDVLASKITNHNLLNIMYVFAGNSYLMESYEKSMNYYKKAVFHALQLNNKFRIDQANKSINLLNSFWIKKETFIEVDEDENSILADKAFNMCNFSKENALEMLNKVNTSSFSNSGKGFYYYYLGIATNNDDYFFESVECFNSDGEKYFKKLPLIELEKMGVKQSILRALSV